MNDLTQLIPLAVGAVISPFPIVATVAILLSARGRTTGPAFAASAALTAFALTLVAALTSSRAGAHRSDGDDLVVMIITSVLVLGFAVLAVISWLTRPRDGRPAKTPGWLAAVDTITPLRAAGLGLVMGLTNAKNLPIELKAGALIGAHDLPLLGVIGLAALFALGATSGVLALTALAATGSERIARALARLKSEMIAHNAVIMTVLFAILAASEAGHLIRMLLH